MDDLLEILRKFKLSEKPLFINAFSHEDGEGEYAVWLITYPDDRYVLKRASQPERDCYEKYLQNVSFAPKLIAQSGDYLLLSYVEGENLMKCDRTALLRAVDCLIAMQSAYWDSEKIQNALQSRINRRNYLNDPLLERAYDAYLQDCMRVPWTLCHDDLLPFNVIAAEGRAVLIDWEHAGILPYPASFARLIAHTSDEPDALFYMSKEDIAAATDAYYEGLSQHRVIDREGFRRSLNLHLFYEYCEWIYVGNKYGDTNGDLLKKYSILATNMAKKLGY